MQPSRYAIATMPLMFIGLAVLLTTTVSGQQVFSLESPTEVEPRGVRVESGVYFGKPGIRVAEEVIGGPASVAILPGVSFRDGTIEVEVAGQVRPDASPTMRGFVGIAFRLRDGEVLRYECFYLRPTNARADDQLRRNHSTQYVSHPEYPWHRLRNESPGVYESYSDINPDEWTQVKIVVRGSRAELYLNGSSHPALIIPELKGSLDEGGIALWIGQGTEGFFRNLRVHHEAAMH